MTTPDYRNFKHSSELYHYGMPRRSGRYPWGSGERPYQSATVKSIDDAVKSNKSVRKERNRFAAAQEVAYQMNYKVANFEKAVDKLSKVSKNIDDEVKDIISVIRKETRAASKNQDLKKEIYDHIYKDSGGENYDLARDFRLKTIDAVYDIVDSPKYMPEFYKKKSKLDKDIDKYNKALADEVDRLVDGDIGSMKIPKMKSGLTYDDVINSVLKYHTERAWDLDVLEERDEAMQDLIFSYTLDEYNQYHGK